MLNCFSVAALEYTWEILLAHYFYLMAILNKLIFMCVAVIFEKYSAEEKYNTQKLNNGPEEPRVYPPTLILIHNIGIWLCIRYHYHLPFLLLIQNMYHPCV